jgi:hypothetical protein
MYTKLMRLLPLVMAVTLAFPSAAQAEERDCRGAIGTETVDNLRAPDGATCTLSGTRVQGTIKVETGATLRAMAVAVVGNVQAENAADVVVTDSTVGGSVQVKQGGSADVTGTAVTGDIQYDQNARPLNASGNRVGGNVQVVGNRAQASIFNNTIDGNLQCKENSPPPVGGGNLVHGSAEDQCASFAGGPGASGWERGGSGGDTVAPVGARAAKVGIRGRARGRLLRLFGSVTSGQRGHSGLTVTVQIRRGGKWRTAKQARTKSRGRYSASVRGRRGKRYALRVVVKRQAGFPATRTSRVVRLRAR